jgi:amino acid transporter
MSNKIGLFSLVLLIVAAIDSIRNLPATALFGTSSIFFFLFAAIVFLLPVAFISAEFSSRYEQGGIFHWVRHGLGENFGLTAIWLQWINTMVWYPTILCFIAGSAAYLIDPLLAQNKIFLVSVTLCTFWLLTLLNLRGVHVSAKINSICGILGLLLPMTFLILLGAIWFFTRKEIHLSFDANDLIPSFKSATNWTSLIAVMASFLGMELAGVHIGDIENPSKNFPKALGWSVLLLLSTMIFGSLSIATVVAEKDIRLVDGIMQTFTLFFEAFQLQWALPILAFLIIIGSTGSMINWLISPAKGLLQAAQHGFLPLFFAKTNSQNVPVRLLITQAILVTLFCLSVILMPSVNAFYWFLTSLSTQLYMFMYILLFVSALLLKRPNSGYEIPKGFRTLFCLLGLSGCFLTVFVGYFSPEEMGFASTSSYAIAVAAITSTLILPAPLLCAYRKQKRSLTTQ